MKKLWDIMRALVLIAILIAVGWFPINWFLSFFGSASDNVKATSITALVSVTIFSMGRYFESRRDSKQRLNAEKIEVYKRFFDFYFDVFSYEKIHDEPMPPKKLLSDMIEFQKEVVFWGSDAVIKEYLDFKDKLTEFSSRPAGDDKDHQARLLASVFSSTAKLLSAMRRDVGYTFTSFSAQDLARLQLNNDADTQPLRKGLGL